MSAIILFCLAVRRRTLDRQSRVSKDADILLSAFFAWRLVRGEIIELTERTEDGLGVMSVVVRGLDRGLSSYVVRGLGRDCRATLASSLGDYRVD